MPQSDAPAVRYVQEQLPLNIRPLLRAAWPCPQCRGLLTMRRRRFVCGDCGYSEATPEAVRARVAGQPELPLFEEEDFDGRR